MTSIVFATAPTPPAGLRTEPIFVIASVIELGMGLDEPDDDDPPPPVASTKVGLEVTPEFLPNIELVFEVGISAALEVAIPAIIKHGAIIPIDKTLYFDAYIIPPIQMQECISEKID